MKTTKIYTDTIHGYIAECGSKTTAWALIRNKCKEDGKEVPTMDKIVEAGNTTPETVLNN